MDRILASQTPVRYLVLSDLHANLEATDAVLTAAAELRTDACLVLGDLVGYGPDPAAVFDRVRALPRVTMIRGNHDRVAAGLSADTEFNPHAQAAIRWTTRQLTPDLARALAELPVGPMTIDDDVQICHGSPLDEDTYVFSARDAELAGAAAARRICLLGHTHVAGAFGRGPAIAQFHGPFGRVPYSVDLSTAATWVINPGSVGQPRDGDWRAAFALLDTAAGTCELHRTEYDADATRRKMQVAGLPPILISRIGPGTR